MIAALLTLPTALLATQITISEVSAERESGRVAITVKGDAMIDPEAASAKLTDGHLYLFVRDARVHEANRSWKDGAVDGEEEIRAHRHRQKVELVVPLGDEGCQGPVELEKTAGGLRALVACDGGPRPRAVKASRPAAKEAAPVVASRSADEDDDEIPGRPEAPRLPVLVPAPVEAVPARLTASDATELKAKLALDSVKAMLAPASPRLERGGAPAPRPTAVAPMGPIVAASPVTAAVRVSGSVAPAPLVIPTAPRLELPAVAANTSATSGATSAESRDKLAPASGGGGAGVWFAGGVLMAIAGAAFFFSRRRAVGSRHIQILETASLGPKRALVVARVGDATLILGSSEAGISLLQALPDAAARVMGAAAPPAVNLAASGFVNATIASAAASASEGGVAPRVPAILGAAGSVEPAARSSAAEVSASDPASGGLGALAPAPALIAADEGRGVGQAGLLARLFKRGNPANDSSAPRFEDVLEDSFEDQELRRKLALGLPGRVR